MLPARDVVVAFDFITDVTRSLLYLRLRYLTYVILVPYGWSFIALPVCALDCCCGLNSSVRLLIHVEFHVACIR